MGRRFTFSMSRCGRPQAILQRVRRWPESVRWRQCRRDHERAAGPAYLRDREGVLPCEHLPSFPLAHRGQRTAQPTCSREHPSSAAGACVRAAAIGEFGGIEPLEPRPISHLSYGVAPIALNLSETDQLNTVKSRSSCHSRPSTRIVAQCGRAGFPTYGAGDECIPNVRCIRLNRDLYISCQSDCAHRVQQAQFAGESVACQRISRNWQFPASTWHRMASDPSSAVQFEIAGKTRPTT